MGVGGGVYKGHLNLKEGADKFVLLMEKTLAGEEGSGIKGRMLTQY